MGWGSNGFVPIRRGILEHLRDGRITHGELAAYIVMILEADSKTGIWKGSARALAALYGWTQRGARHVLERLERKGYIRRFATPRSHANYPVLIDKYLCAEGGLEGRRLNVRASTDWRNPVYENCPQNSAEHGPEDGAERAPKQQREGKIKTTLDPALPPAKTRSVGGDCFTLQHPSRIGRPKQPEYDVLAKRVYGFYVETMGESAAQYKLTPHRQAMLKRRARELYETLRKENPHLSDAELLAQVERLMCECISQLAASDFHMGRAPAETYKLTRGHPKRYADLKHDFGSYEKMEEWLNGNDSL